MDTILVKIYLCTYPSASDQTKSKLSLMEDDDTNKRSSVHSVLCVTTEFRHCHLQKPIVLKQLDLFRALESLLKWNSRIN